MNPKEMFGKFRGVVEATDDPERRLRCRVRVAGVHYEATSVAHLPWAELVLPFSAPGAGDFHHFERGDRVWVEFERGNVEHPVIVGGWVAKRRGIDDLPADKVSDHERGLRRWTRLDRAGNMIELSENGDELHVKLKSGRGVIRISQIDDSIEIETPSVVRVQAGQATIQAGQAFVECGDIVASANGKTGSTPTGMLTLMSNMDVNILVRDAAHGGNPAGEINVGQTLSDGGITDANGTPQQSPRVNIQAAQVNIGGGTLPTTNVTIEAANQVVVEAAVKATVNAGVVDIIADTVVNIDAPQINVGL